MPTYKITESFRSKYSLNLYRHTEKEFCLTLHIKNVVKPALWFYIRNQTFKHKIWTRAQHNTVFCVFLGFLLVLLQCKRRQAEKLFREALHRKSMKAKINH